jgi:hypothetical protein
VAQPCGMVVYIQSARESGMIQISGAVGFPFRDNAGRITQVIYQDNLGDHVDFWDYRNDKRKSSYAVRRTYIDIGAGVPGWDDSEDGASGGVND